MSIEVTFVEAFIEQHIANLRSPQDVAEHVGIPYHTLRKDFRRERGMTLGTFIMQTRMEQAKHLLTTTDLLCFEVSYAVGFTREDVAARAFKQHAGMTMQNYRRQFGNTNEGDAGL